MIHELMPVNEMHMQAQKITLTVKHINYKIKQQLKENNLVPQFLAS